MSQRVYRGLSAEERSAQRRAQLVAAALDVLAAPGGPQSYGVRAVCRAAGLASRYFYEGFGDAAELAGVVYDETVAGVAAVTLAAVQDRDDDLPAVVQAGIDALVDHLRRDPRRARLLFAPELAALPVIAERRKDSTRLFVTLLEAQAREAVDVPAGAGARVAVVSDMLVGGVAQAVSAWFTGDLDVSQEELVDGCSDLILAASGLAK